MWNLGLIVSRWFMNQRALIWDSHTVITSFPNWIFHVTVPSLLPCCFAWKPPTHSSCLSSGLWTGSRQKTKAVQLRSSISLPVELRLSYPALIQLPQVSTHAHTHTVYMYLDQILLQRKVILNYKSAAILTVRINIYVFRGPWWGWHPADYR